MKVLKFYFYMAVIIIGLKINVCKTNSLKINESSDSDDCSVSTDDGDSSEDDENDIGLEIIEPQEVCKLPIVKWHCRGDSRSISEFESYFSYNPETRRCEEFINDGCGNVRNRFLTANDCWKTCYTPLDYFLAKVKERLKLRFGALKAMFR